GADRSPVEEGLVQYTKKGCVTCHSTDGTPKVGPSWKGLFGSTRTFADGSTAKVDENYLRQSILEPNAQIVEGFAPAMPPFQGQVNDKQLDGLIEYIKSVK